MIIAKELKDDVVMSRMKFIKKLKYGFIYKL